MRARRESRVSRPWEPLRTDDFFTVQAQRADLERALEAHAREAMVPLAIVDKDGQLIGRIDINGITRGAFQSATVGYWVSQLHNGQGFASEIAFTQLRLHRLQAETLLHNSASQRVLACNGFQPFAIAATPQPVGQPS